MKQEGLAVIGLLAVCLLVYLGSLLWGQVKAAELVQKQQKQAKAELRAIVATKNADEFTTTMADPWGMPYQTEVVDSGEKAFRTYVVKSAGPDKLYGTRDDLTVKDTDVNWTNSGKSIGTRTGRSLRGFVKGLKESDDGQ